MTHDDASKAQSLRSFYPETSQDAIPLFSAQVYRPLEVVSGFRSSSELLCLVIGKLPRRFKDGLQSHSCLVFYIEYMFLCLVDTPYPESPIHPLLKSLFGSPPATAAISSGSHIAQLRHPGSALAAAWQYYCWFAGIVFTCAPGQLANYRGFRSCGLVDDVEAVALMLVGIITDVGPKVGCPRSEVDPEESFLGTLVGASSVPSCLCGWEGVDPGFKSAKFTCSERKRRHWSLELHIRILQRAINFHPPSATALRQLQRSPAQATRDLSRLRSSCSFAAACAHLNSKNPNLAHQCKGAHLRLLLLNRGHPTSEVWMTASCDTLAARTRLLERVTAVAALHIGSSASLFASEAYSGLPARVRNSGIKSNLCLLSNGPRPSAIIDEQARHGPSAPRAAPPSHRRRSPDELILFAGSAASVTCVGAIIGHPSDLPWIFGYPFLKSIYSVFRLTPPAIGFAQLSTEAGGKGTTSTNPGARSSKKKSHVGAIAGGVIGGVVTAALISGIFFLLSHQRHRDHPQHTAYSADPPLAPPPAHAPLSFVVDDPKDDAVVEKPPPPARR
ncbi:hypothetical protein C8J57DRAFT_1588913 [Mycena rebaudengoi]|nr:hypothetical protein C8J57DRAFT_1588913 [Mycena rebaudengoi]